jgi:hypothetical protein
MNRELSANPGVIGAVTIGRVRGNQVQRDGVKVAGAHSFSSARGEKVTTRMVAVADDR